MPVEAAAMAVEAAAVAVETAAIAVEAAAIAVEAAAMAVEAAAMAVEAAAIAVEAAAIAVEAAAITVEAAAMAVAVWLPGWLLLLAGCCWHLAGTTASQGDPRLRKHAQVRGTGSSPGVAGSILQPAWGPQAEETCPGEGNRFIPGGW